MKECRRCLTSKPVAEFTSRKGSSDGLHSWCRECKRSYEARYRVTNPEAVRRKQARYKAAEKLKEQQALEAVRGIRNQTL